MFGLMDSSQLTATQSANARRKVFHRYPQGKFPLMGLLSLMPDGEETDKQSWTWSEDRHMTARTITAVANSGGPFTTTSGASGAVGVDQTSGGWTYTVNSTTVRIKVADVSLFRVRDVVWVKNAPGATSTIKQLKGVVDAVYTAQNTMDVRCIGETVTSVLNDSTSVGLYVIAVGIATVEGGYSKSGGYTFPIEPGNYTQIFRTPVGPFTRNSIKMGQRFDSGGIYKEYATKAHLRHMELMELACYFGVKNTTSVTDSDDNVSKTEKTFAGIEWFMRDWEKGTSGSVIYRPGGSDISASAWDADDDKRILRFSGGTITKNQWNSILEKAFFYSSESSFEKLLVCGSGLLSVFNKFAEQNSIKTVNLNSKEDSYGMQVTRWESVYGTLIFKSHPLFTENPALRYSGFILDVGSLKFMPFQDSDTELLKNRMANDYDGRKDEWLTEFGLEVRFPERHVYIDNLQGISS